MSPPPAPTPPSSASDISDIERRASMTAIIDELLEGWDRFTGETRLLEFSTGARKGRNRSKGQMGFVIAMITHTHEATRLLRHSMPERMTAIHTPLMRMIYECTITAVWADEVDDGFSGKLYQHKRSRRALYKTLVESLTGGKLPQSTAIPPESSSDNQANNFEQLTKDVALPHAYAYYRIMSGQCHASLELAESYTLFDGDRITFLKEPLFLENDWYYHLIIRCLIWSGMVANYYDPKRSRRSELRRIARAAGIDPELPVLYTAVERGRHRKKKGTTFIE